MNLVWSEPSSLSLLHYVANIQFCPQKKGTNKQGDYEDGSLNFAIEFVVYCFDFHNQSLLNNWYINMTI